MFQQAAGEQQPPSGVLEGRGGQGASRKHLQVHQPVALDVGGDLLLQQEQKVPKKRGEVKTDVIVHNMAQPVCAAFYFYFDLVTS